MAVPAHDDAAPVLPAGLTPAQVEAITAPDRVLAVLAGAGTGKTRVLTLRVARRVRDGSAAGRHVLVCTFSRKAADELRHRLFALGVGEITAGTFHRTAWQLVRRHRLDQGLPELTLLPDRKGVLTRLLEADRPPRPRGPAGGGSRVKNATAAAPPRRALQLDAEIAWAKARMLSPGRYEEAARRAGRRSGLPAGTVADWFERYQTHLRRQRALDLDDLLVVAAETIEDDPRLASAVHWRFRHLFVDEMQDVNPAQFRLLETLFGSVPDLFVVGDPHQSIYGWNGADPSLLERLPELVPGTRVLRLDENHRCSPQIVAVASAALGLGSGPRPTSGRPDGPLPVLATHETDAEEAAWVAQRAWMARRPGTRWSSIAVLARTNAQLGAVAEALHQAHIPYRFAGSDLAPASDLAPETVGKGGTERRSWPPEDEDDLEEELDGVVLATFHRAKGLQWPTVFVIGVSDGLVPLRSARRRLERDEERRLLYVALTRAEREVSVSWARCGPGGVGDREPSPWLGEVERTRTALAAGETPVDPGLVASRLADLRRRLGSETDLLR